MKHLSDLPDSYAVHNSGKEEGGIAPVFPTGLSQVKSAAVCSGKYRADNRQFDRTGQVFPVETDEQKHCQADQKDCQSENDPNVKGKFLDCHCRFGGRRFRRRSVAEQNGFPLLLREEIFLCPALRLFV